ncbi:uncharacterized protein LOC118438106 [Folsomia candida]|uniref:Uncharacterized protein n=1 Tax=Folsomia candida TaxID=158441 RepID=A0A226DHF4_FOLCA|nr:uncharacterized protein LOC118438106 [Folsomia candida]OXA44982.1 hypothetical protein Fcan01_19850 [Folsomia candida]
MSLLNLIWALILVIASQHASAQKWRRADLTNYWSYPPCCDDPNYPDQSECRDYSGCKYRGQFAFVSGTKSEAWVKANNIIAIHHKDAGKYKLKTLELRANGKTIKAKVYDECNDKDCNNCCTKNSKRTKFLIDIERNTMKHFGGKGDGIVEWRCLDC